MALRTYGSYSIGTLQGIYGTGSAGAYTASSGFNTLSSIAQYTTVTLSSTAILSPNQFVLRANEAIILTGTSTITAFTASDDSSSGVLNKILGYGMNGGVGGTSGTPVGGNGLASQPTSLGGAGGHGGASSSGTNQGGTGGTAGFGSALDYTSLASITTGYCVGWNGLTSTQGWFQILGGAGGGGGGYDSTFTNNGGVGGTGGGVLVLCAPIIDLGSGCTISAQGQRGYDATGPGAGAGGGGGGGTAILVCSQLIENGTITVVGGTGGSSTGGSPGLSGSAGTIIRYIGL